MHKIKAFVGMSAAMIMEYMESHDDPLTEAEFVHMCNMCEGFNAVCKTIRNIQDHHDGSLYDMDDDDGLDDQIVDEFEAAEDYYCEYMATGDKDYLMFMSQEIEHGRKPLMQLKATARADHEHAHVKRMLAWHDSLVEKHDTMADRHGKAMTLGSAATIRPA